MPIWVPNSCWKARCTFSSGVIRFRWLTGHIVAGSVEALAPAHGHAGAESVWDGEPWMRLMSGMPHGRTASWLGCMAASSVAPVMSRRWSGSRRGWRRRGVSALKQPLYVTSSAINSALVVGDQISMTMPNMILIIPAVTPCADDRLHTWWARGEVIRHQESCVSAAFGFARFATVMMDDRCPLASSHSVGTSAMAPECQVLPNGLHAMDDRFAPRSCRYLSPAPSRWAAP